MIEKKIHRLWLGPKPMPEHYVEYGRQWQEMNPDWEVIEWNAETIPDVINVDIWDAVGKMAKSSITMDWDRAIAVQRADVLGYELIWRFGGIYMNCDIQPIQPLDGLIAQTGERAFACFEGYYNERRYLVNAVLGGPKEHPFWKDCIDTLPARYLNMMFAPMEQTTGPHLITDVYERGWYKRTDEFVALEEYYFNPVHFRDIAVGQDASDRVEWAREQGAYGLHHWGHREDQANYV
jgi:mannosyltransferase OCH1-like enzyme